MHVNHHHRRRVGSTSAQTENIISAFLARHTMLMVHTHIHSYCMCACTMYHSRCVGHAAVMPLTKSSEMRRPLQRPTLQTPSRHLSPHSKTDRPLPLAIPPAHVTKNSPIKWCGPLKIRDVEHAERKRVFVCVCVRCASTCEHSSNYHTELCILPTFNQLPLHDYRAATGKLLSIKFVM